MFSDKILFKKLHAWFFNNIKNINILPKKKFILRKSTLKFYYTNDTIVMILRIFKAISEIDRFRKQRILLRGMSISLLHMWDNLRDLLSFVQLKKHGKNPWWKDTFSKVARWSQCYRIAQSITYREYFAISVLP